MWVAGCSLACPGCINPGFWPADAGREVETAELAARIAAVPGLRGVTLSGGEPLEQPEAVAEFLAMLEPRLDSIVFTGFSPAELLGDARKARALARADLAIAGRYERERAGDADPWAGSSNKTVLALSGRIRPDEFPSCRVEAQIAPDGRLIVTGFPPADFRP